MNQDQQYQIIMKIVIIIKKLKYWSLIQKFAKFVVKELENTIIMEVKCVQVAGPFFVEQFKAMVLKVGGNFNPGLFNSKLPPRIVSTPDFSTINFSILFPNQICPLPLSRPFTPR